jgi:hypothetical protein
MTQVVYREHLAKKKQAPAQTMANCSLPFWRGLILADERLSALKSSQAAEP